MEQIIAQILKDRPFLASLKPEAREKLIAQYLKEMGYNVA